MPGRAAPGREGRSERTGSRRAPAHPGQRRVRSGGCTGAGRPSTAGGARVRPLGLGSQPPPPQHHPLVQSRPARGASAVGGGSWAVGCGTSAVSGAGLPFPLASLSHRGSPSRPTGAPAGLKGGPDGSRRLRSKLFCRPPSSSNGLGAHRNPASRKPRVPRPRPTSRRRPLTHAFPQPPQGCATADAGTLRHLQNR